MQKSSKQGYSARTIIRVSIAPVDSGNSELGIVQGEFKIIQAGARGGAHDGLTSYALWADDSLLAHFPASDPYSAMLQGLLCIRDVLLTMRAHAEGMQAQQESKQGDES